MNKANVRKWVKALRSGKYKQTRNTLYDGKGYCCLGVACKLAGIKPEQNGSLYYFDERAGVLPQKAVDWLGVESLGSDPEIGGHSVSHYNDYLEWNFPEIADLIEENILGAK